MVQTLEETDTFDLVFPQRALYKAPGVVELGLNSDMRLGKFFLVLQPEDLEGADMGRGVSVRNSECIGGSRVAAA